ncbi:hypothetical protein QMU85_002083 [Photobacterium damselae]|nr:hypothetical protein [Photobacterium damselae]
MISKESSIHPKIFPELTVKQFEVLLHYALGKSAKDIQISLGCSRTAIEKHLTEIRYKFNCQNSSELRVIFFMRIITNLNL